MDKILAVLAFSFFTLASVNVGAYDVKCADKQYWDDRLVDSKVERYITLDEEEQVRYFLTGMSLDIKDTTNKVVVLYNKDYIKPTDPIGILVFEDGCARKQAVAIPKIVADNLLGEMLHKGYID